MQWNRYKIAFFVLLVCGSLIIAEAFVIVRAAIYTKTLRDTLKRSQSALRQKDTNTAPITADMGDVGKKEEATKPASSNMEQWMPAILAMFGSLIVVVMTAWLNTKALSSQMDALRAEMRQAFAEFRLEVRGDASVLTHRVERLEEERRGNR